MGYVTSELINLFNFLLPGFITSFLFYSLTSFPKKSEFEMVVMALIYTVIINALVEVWGWMLITVGNSGCLIGEWSSAAKVLWSVFFALLIGFLLTFFYNNDLLHKLLRKLNITNQTSYPSEWYGTFSETRHSYVVLHLIDGRRIMGWPLEWPSSPKSGHFVLEDAVWLAEDNGEAQNIELINVKKIMLDTTNVTMVEFMKQAEVKNES
jgi:hypothetical protein